MGEIMKVDVGLDGSKGRYYWLKLKRDFFKRHDVCIVEDMPNGKEYLLFYLKLLCESVDHDGNLRFGDRIPYSPEMLSSVTRTNVDIVRSAVKVFTELDMMEILDDGTIFMTEVTNMIGSAANNDNANRQRRFREKKKQLALSGSYGAVTNNNERKKIEKEIDIEKDIEIEEDKEDKTTCQQVVDLFNSICKSFSKVRSLSEARKKAIRARLKNYTLDDFREVFTKAENSNFLKGRNDRDWSANFDWLIKDSNMAKVLDGNYDNRGDSNGRHGSGEGRAWEARGNDWRIKADVE